ncbi:MAG: hypothetical protein V1495_03655 [Pseudomonadota bacterium]
MSAKLILKESQDGLNFDFRSIQSVKLSFAVRLRNNQAGLSERTKSRMSARVRHSRELREIKYRKRPVRPHQKR